MMPTTNAGIARRESSKLEQLLAGERAVVDGPAKADADARRPAIADGARRLEQADQRSVRERSGIVSATRCSAAAAKTPPTPSPVRNRYRKKSSGDFVEGAQGR